MHIDGRIAINFNGFWIRLNTKTQQRPSSEQLLMLATHNHSLLRVQAGRLFYQSFRHQHMQKLRFPTQTPMLRGHKKKPQKIKNEREEKKITRAAASSFISTFSCLKPVSKGLIAS